MRGRRVLVKALILVVCVFLFSAPTALARICNSDYDCDGNVDGSDAYNFKLDFFKFDCTNKPAPVPKTEQTLCYDTDGNPRDCAGTGEDGEYQKGIPSPAPRFIDHGDGTVTDNLTGLMWTKNAQQIPEEMTWQAALDACNNLVCARYDDWRLPNLNELNSLIDRTNWDPALPSGHAFTNVVPYYWSSTTHVILHYGAWYVNFSDGRIYLSTKSLEFYVWAVRGGQ